MSKDNVVDIGTAKQPDAGHLSRCLVGASQLHAHMVSLRREIEKLPRGCVTKSIAANTLAGALLSMHKEAEEAIEHLCDD